MDHRVRNQRLVQHPQCYELQCTLRWPSRPYVYIEMDNYKRLVYIQQHRSDLVPVYTATAFFVYICTHLCLQRIRWVRLYCAGGTWCNLVCVVLLGHRRDFYRNRKLSYRELQFIRYQRNDECVCGEWMRNRNRTNDCRHHCGTTCGNLQLHGKSVLSKWC